MTTLLFFARFYPLHLYGGLLSAGIGGYFFVEAMMREPVPATTTLGGAALSAPIANLSTPIAGIVMLVGVFMFFRGWYLANMRKIGL